MSDTPYTPPYHYCPRCGAELPRHEPFRQECTGCGFILYHSSSPCIGALPLDSRGRVLLGRRGIDPWKGSWNTIGGFLNYGEDPLEGLAREVHEETGAQCRIDQFVTMHSETYGPGGQALLNVYFTVELLNPEITPRDDVVELQWFALDDLPEDIAFASDRKALAVLRQRRLPPRAVAHPSHP